MTIVDNKNVHLDPLSIAPSAVISSVVENTMDIINVVTSTMLMVSIIYKTNNLYSLAPVKDYETNPSDMEAVEQHPMVQEIHCANVSDPIDDPRFLDVSNKVAIINIWVSPIFDDALFSLGFEKATTKYFFY